MDGLATLFGMLLVAVYLFHSYALLFENRFAHPTWPEQYLLCCCCHIVFVYPRCDDVCLCSTFSTLLIDFVIIIIGGMSVIILT